MKHRIQERDKEIGANIRSIRNSEGSSMKRVSDEMGISYQQIQKYELGQNRVSLSFAEKLAKLLKVNINRFLK